MSQSINEKIIDKVYQFRMSEIKNSITDQIYMKLQERNSKY